MDKEHFFFVEIQGFTKKDEWKDLMFHCDL